MFVKPEKLRYLKATKASNSMSGVFDGGAPLLGLLCQLPQQQFSAIKQETMRALSLIIICAFGKMKNDRNNEPGYIVEYRYEVNLRS